MSRTVNVLAAIIAVALYASVMESSSSDVCQRRDCDRYDVPSSKDRVCRMYNTSDYIGLEWYTGTLDSARCTVFGRSTSRDISRFCPGHVGMNMSLWCDFVHFTSVIYKDGVPFTNEPTVTFNRLQKEDEGLYQCRRHGSLELIAEFNMTVQNEIRIGGSRYYECIPFYCTAAPFNQQKCCYYSAGSITEPHTLTPFTLSVYGDSPINTAASVYWTTDPTIHYPTDLGLHLERNEMDATLLEMYIDHYPQSVTRDALHVIVQISASNNFSSFSTCILVDFNPTGILSTDPSLPQDVLTTEGSDATFTCEFGTNRPRPLVSPQPIITFKFIYGGSENDTSQSVVTANCSSWTLCKQWAPHSFPNLTTISLICVPVVNLSNFVLYRYEIHLTNVTAELNGSMFTCSIATPITSPHLEQIELTQWEGSAELIVALTDKSTVLVPSADHDLEGHGHRTNLAPILVPLCVILVLLLIISGVVVGLVVWKRYQTHQGHHNLAGMENWEPLKSKEDCIEH